MLINVSDIEREELDEQSEQMLWDYGNSLWKLPALHFTEATSIKELQRLQDVFN
jgi:hypothetical protein